MRFRNPFSHDRHTSHTTNDSAWLEGITSTPAVGEYGSEVKAWQSLQEGQLLVDVYDRPDAIVVKALIAGVRPDDVDISFHEGLLTIRAQRSDIEEVYEEQYLCKECYWGDFSRTIIIPVPIREEGIKAFFKHGILQVVLPKILKKRQVSLKTEDDFLDE